MIPLKINDKHLCEIFEPTLDVSGWDDATIQSYSIRKLMFPTEVALTSETYSRDAERTADYELEHLVLVNRKAKPEFTWNLIKAPYVQNLMLFLKYGYDFKNTSGIVTPVPADPIIVEYCDFTGIRRINAYLGQTIEGVLVEYEGELYWQNFRLAFPER